MASRSDLTTSDPSREQPDRTPEGSSLTRARKKVSGQQRAPILTQLRHLSHQLYWAWRDTRACLNELKAELRNVYHRMGILRAKRLHKRGMAILSASERAAFPPHLQRILLCARI